MEGVTEEKRREEEMEKESEGRRNTPLRSRRDNVELRHHVIVSAGIESGLCMASIISS